MLIANTLELKKSYIGVKELITANKIEVIFDGYGYDVLRRVC